MVGNRAIVGILAASNTLLLAHALWPSARRWMRRLRFILQRLVVSSFEPITDDLLGRDYVPPLPKPIADALERSRLCFLATAGASLDPHLSLMRFTYCRGLDEPEPSEVMIISTQRKTKKFDIITENTNVALLVHDFATHADDANADYSPIGNRPRYSITLNGHVRVEKGELAERYRAIHLARNEAYSQFIVGDDIAIITVHLQRARVCDVNDRVSHFKRDGSTWSELPLANGPPSPTATPAATTTR